MADDEVTTVPDPEAARGIDPPDLASSRYDLRGSLGKGGMGEVFLAHDRAIGRDVAIKRMRDPGASRRAHARFLREARIQARLDHPSIVPVHELGVDADGRPYIVMKRLAGRTLRRCEGAPRRVLLRAFVDVCLAVEYAHTRGVIHRDLKPENIVLGDFGEVYVLDWGVAKIAGDSDLESGEEAPQDGELATRAGSAIGTPGYMAPEQARGERDVDARADIYALGCILHEILTGLEVGASPPARDALSDREVPIELEEACMSALSLDPAQRPASARTLADHVQAYLDGDRDLEHRRALATEHLARARSVLAAGDDHAHRSIAMREAGRALALDPNRDDAIAVIGSLMLQPPPDAPADVEREIEAERVALLRGNAPAATLSLLGFIAFVLMIYATTEARGAEIAMIVALTAVIAGVTVWSRSITRILPWVSVVSAFALACLVGMFAHLYPPFLVAPALGGVMAMALPFTMQHQQRWFGVYCVVLMILAVLVPFAGEALGLIPATYTFNGDGVQLHTPALRGPRTWQLAIAALYVIVAVAFSGWLGHQTRQSERRARRQLHLQAWHLRQLVSR